MEELNTQPVASENTEGDSTGWGRFLLDLLETLLLSAALFLVINALSARVRVDGSSMLPTLKNGEFVLVNRLAYRFDTPQRGDIVVFHYPPDPKQDLIKRVIGLAGDTVTIQGGIVYVNDTPLVEPYISQPPHYTGTWIVPEGHLFVLGDNRNDSSDSHSWGMLPLENIVGKAVLIYWPFQNLQWIDHYDLVKATHD
ncbi:MAG: signal peptidase I [Anaerolineae bacterium]|nr:MAG: signal peptidase I [Anaerolineae bacterium]